MQLASMACKNGLNIGLIRTQQQAMSSEFSWSAAVPSTLRVLSPVNPDVPEHTLFKVGNYSFGSNSIIG